MLLLLCGLLFIIDELVFSEYTLNTTVYISFSPTANINTFCWGLQIILIYSLLNGKETEYNVHVNQFDSNI